MGIDYTKRPGNQQANPPAGGPGVSLSKITLTKSTPAISLTKQGATTGELRVNLRWTARDPGQRSGGFLKRAVGAASGGIDLDLACMYEFSDGSKGIVQALGNSFRAPAQGRPIIVLDGDDRTGGGGENMTIDLSATGAIRRLLIFAYIYEGVPNWAAADGVVTLVPVRGPEIEVRLDEHQQGAMSCAIALVENRGGELVVNREVRYIRGAQDAVDAAYGWGMQWTRGRK
ncbi:TerD family protein [Williamsia sterculiae]|uniref:Tellurite resistance protein TerA n=1 Tax=Williamsia sterculiae TaxID=1344003 RepID=A0A1N7E1W0_9NOCA|nr:tellerium resistance protein [Williamsia sterculiae]SIR82087.1 tellurite resistance protein TerA [Williamsia sterculiae]